MRHNRKQALGHRRRSPLVQQLEARGLLASISPVSVDFFTGLRTVTVTGDSASETWTIDHDGSGGVRISGPVSATRSDVQQLNVRTNGGADSVTYNLNADLVTGFNLDVDTGDDGFVTIIGTDDRFVANLNGNIRSSLKINVQTRGFTDRLVVNANRDNVANGVRIASGRTLDLNLQAGDNADTIDVNYQGDMDGKLKIAASGDGGGLLANGPDIINALVIMDSDSGHITGHGGIGTFDMRLDGNGGNDTFSALVGDHSGGNVHFDQALVTSGATPPLTLFPPPDKVTHTANVDVVAFQPDTAHDTIVSAPAFADRRVTSPVARGSAATLSGVITEPDPGDTFFLDVNWGDGTPTQTLTFAPGTFVSGQTVATATHVYTHVGHYQVHLTWRDQTGLSNDDVLVVKVLPPQATHPHERHVAAAPGGIPAGSQVAAPELLPQGRELARRLVRRLPLQSQEQSADRHLG